MCNSDSRATNDEYSKHIFFNKKHVNYYQIQGQLHVTQRDYCLFATWTNEDIKVERVERDDNFWKEEMEPKLMSFFNEALLPEMINPKQARSKSVRF